MTDLREHQERLWIVAAAPVIWALHFALAYATAALGCGKLGGTSGSPTTVRVAIALYTLVALVAVAWLGWRGYKRHRLGGSALPHENAPRGSPSLPRLRHVAPVRRERTGDPLRGARRRVPQELHVSRISIALGVVVLAGVWLGPLPALAASSFSAHMTMHMGVVAVAAPLLALGVAGGRLDPVTRAPSLFPPVPWSIVELAVVWTWHTPALHHAARHGAGAFAIEQTSFLLAGFVVWIAAFGGGAHLRAERTGAGVLALLLTSMHMTLLGALLALAPRPLFAHGSERRLDAALARRVRRDDVPRPSLPRAPAMDGYGGRRLPGKSSRRTPRLGS